MSSSNPTASPCATGAEPPDCAVKRAASSRDPNGVHSPPPSPTSSTPSSPPPPNVFIPGKNGLLFHTNIMALYQADPRGWLAQERELMRQHKRLCKPSPLLHHPSDDEDSGDLGESPPERPKKKKHRGNERNAVYASGRPLTRAMLAAETEMVRESMALAEREGGRRREVMQSVEPVEEGDRVKEDSEGEETEEQVEDEGEEEDDEEEDDTMSVDNDECVENGGQDDGENEEDEGSSGMSWEDPQDEVYEEN